MRCPGTGRRRRNSVCASVNPRPSPAPPRRRECPRGRSLPGKLRSGFGPDSYKFAAGKPLSLIDGTGLLALCQKHGILARTLSTGPRESGP